MEEKKYSLEFTIDEIVLLLAGVELFHKEGAENFYKSLEGLKSKEEELSIDEFDKAHKLCMRLYGVLGDKLQQIYEEEK